MNSTYFTELENSIHLNFAGQKLGSLISGGPVGQASIINLIFAFAGFALLIFLATGGYAYMTSGGDPKKLMGAKTKILNAFTGFLIVFAAYWIVKLVGLIFGLGGITQVFV